MKLDNGDLHTSLPLSIVLLVCFVCVSRLVWLSQRFHTKHISKCDGCQTYVSFAKRYSHTLELHQVK